MTQAPEHLVPLLRDFKRKLRERRGATNTPDAAFNVCWEISHAFLWFCLGAGAKNVRVISVAEPLKGFSTFNKNDALLSHFMVRIGNTYVDWTARQFWEAAPYPMVMDRSELKETWGEIHG